MHLLKNFTQIFFFCYNIFILFIVLSNERVDFVCANERCNPMIMIMHVRRLLCGELDWVRNSIQKYCQFKWGCSLCISFSIMYRFFSELWNLAVLEGAHASANWSEFWAAEKNTFKTLGNPRSLRRKLSEPLWSGDEPKLCIIAFLNDNVIID